jgi:Family of unknown function (DUF6677)
MPSSGSAGSGTSAGAATSTETSDRALRACLAAWFVPGAGHFILGQRRKAGVFFVVLSVMFVVGLAFGGRLFPFQMQEPLVFLAAVSEWILLLPRLLAGFGGLGQGDVVAVTYEYGNTFLIVAGLLNALVVMDVLDRARGRSRT